MQLLKKLLVWAFKPPDDSLSCFASQKSWPAILLVVWWIRVRWKLSEDSWFWKSQKSRSMIEELIHVYAYSCLLIPLPCHQKKGMKPCPPKKKDVLNFCTTKKISSTRPKPYELIQLGRRPNLLIKFDDVRYRHPGGDDCILGRVGFKQPKNTRVFT